MRGSTNAGGSYEPLVKTIYTTAFGDVQQVTAMLTYKRIGYKKGVLSGSLKILPNSDPSFVISSIQKISQLLGINFAITPGQYGSWITNNTRIDFHGYGTYIGIYSEGRFQIGRYYRSDYVSGDWSLNDISDVYILFQDLVLTEI